MIVAERLAWVAAALLIVWLASRWLRKRQSRLQGRIKLAAPAKANLIVVVSARCAICPAQKNVVAELRKRYPAALLQVMVVDAENQPEELRSLAVMTVPSTLVLGPDGVVAHVNNGFTRLEVLARQIDNLLLPIICLH